MLMCEHFRPATLEHSFTLNISDSNRNEISKLKENCINKFILKVKFISYFVTALFLMSSMIQYNSLSDPLTTEAINVYDLTLLEQAQHYIFN